MLRYSFDLDREADAVEAAVKQVLADGYRTIDIMPREEERRAVVKQVGTEEMGNLICERICWKSEEDTANQWNYTA